MHCVWKAVLVLNRWLRVCHLTLFPPCYPGFPTELYTLLGEHHSGASTVQHGKLLFWD